MEFARRDCHATVVTKYLSKNNFVVIDVMCMCKDDDKLLHVVLKPRRAIPFCHFAVLPFFHSAVLQKEYVLILSIVTSNSCYTTIVILHLCDDYLVLQVVCMIRELTN